MNDPPRFQIRIFAQSGCELRSENGDWSKTFLSLKGALDFLSDLPGAQITVTTSTDPRNLKLFLPGRRAGRHPGSPVQRWTSVLHTE